VITLGCEIKGVREKYWLAKNLRENIPVPPAD
jgi:hypothetical protein